MARRRVDRLRHGARPADSGGSSSARTDASRPSPPCAECGCAGWQRIVAVASSRPPRGFCGNAAAFGASAACRGRVPVGRPFPDVADHVVEAVAVRRKRPDRRGALVAVRREVLVRERPLPGVRHLAPVRRELVAPGELGAVQPAARGELPFGLGRQLLARPGRVGLGIAVGDMDDRMLVEARGSSCPARMGGASWRRTRTSTSADQSRRSTGCGRRRTPANPASACAAARRDSPSGRAPSRRR